MVKRKTNSISLSITSLVIIGVVIILAIIGGFIYYSSIVQEKEQTSPSSSDNGKVRNVEIKNYAYSPILLEINVGDTVTWTNKDATLKHTITSDSYPPLRSSTLKLEDSFSLKFTESGTYDYYCVFHPIEKGKIIVR